MQICFCDKFWLAAKFCEAFWFSSLTNFRRFELGHRKFDWELAILVFSLSESSVFSQLNQVLMKFTSLLTDVNQQGRLGNTIASVALVHTSIQSD